MSSGSRRVRARRAGGFTLLEVSIVLVLLTGMALVVERTLTSTRNADRYLNAIRRAKEAAEAAAYRAHEAVSASRRLFDNDITGQEYLTALDLSRFPLASGSRLPRFDELSPLGPDLPGDPRTGNVLLFVREVDPVAISADVAVYPQRYIDVYHFVCIYRHEANRVLIIPKGERAVDLVIWYSVPFPSYQQVAAITDPVEQQKIVESLRAIYGFTYTWDATAALDDAFYELRDAGQLASLPATDFLIPEHPGLSEGGLLVHHDTQLAATTTDMPQRRGVFTVDANSTWAPNGFEVKITGSSGHRKVWMHLVVESQSTRSQTAVHASTLIASVRDL